MSGKERKLLLKVRLAKEAERYDDMARLITQLIRTSRNDVIDESLVTLMSVAFKNAVGERRASWRSISTWEPTEPEDGDDVVEREVGEEEAILVQSYLESIGTKSCITVHRYW